MLSGSTTPTRVDDDPMRDLYDRSIDPKDGSSFHYFRLAGKHTYLNHKVNVDRSDRVQHKSRSPVRHQQLAQVDYYREMRVRRE